MTAFLFLLFHLSAIGSQDEIPPTADRGPERIDTLIQYAFDKRYEDPGQAMAFAIEAEQLAIDLHQPEERDWASAIQVILHANRDEDTIAIRKINELGTDILSGQDSRTGYVLMAAGKSYFNVGLEEKARDYFMKAIDHFQRTGSPSDKVKAHIDYGSQLAKRGLYTEGLDQFKLAHDIALKNDLRPLLSDIYRYLSNVSNRLENFDDAKRYVRRNIALSAQSGSYEKIGDGYLSLANILNEHQETDSAFYYYRRALDNYHTIDNDLGRTYAFANMAELFSDMGEVDSATYYYQLAEKHLPPSSAYKRLGVYINIGLAGIYVKQGANELAESLLTRSLAVSQSMREYEMIRESLQLLSEVKEQQQEPDSALHYFKLYKQYADTIQNNSTERAYANFRIQLAATESEHEIGLLQQRLALNRTRTTAIIIVSILFIGLSLLGILYFRSSSKNRRLAYENSEISKKFIEQELAIREKELADFTLNRVQKNRFLDELQSLIKNSPTSQASDYSKITRAIDMHRLSEKDWEDFYKYFGNVHKEFFEKLKAQFPDLTASDLKHAALVKLNLSLKEAAQVFGVEPKSIKMARYRLKKKLNLSESDRLDQFLFTVE